MFGRIFGRGKDEPEQAVCAKCGRTLLAGEWTRKIVDADGEERLVCSLCGPDLPLDEDQPPDVTWTPANNGRVRETREDVPPALEVDETARQLAAKDATIVSLQERLARAEAHNQELSRELSRLRASVDESVPEESGTDESVPEESGTEESDTGAIELPSLAAVAAEEEQCGADASGMTSGEEDHPVDSSEPGERTWGETPAEFAAQFGTEFGVPAAAAGIAEAAATADEQPPQDEGTPIPSAVFEDTQPLAVTETDESVAGEAEDLRRESESAVAFEELSAAEAAPGDAEAEVAALALLQRGVDLFNVSRVPRKIAETNEQLGMPVVHADPEDPAVALTFMWSMGWYRFQVDTETGDVTMADRGYEEIKDLPPNAGVRPDGTVHLAPAQISRAAAQRIQQEDHLAGSQGSERPVSEPESPRSAAQKPPEILSKSLLGQRSDDGPAVWEQTKARDFDWDR